MTQAKNSAEAIGYFRAAVALRPSVVSIRLTLVTALNDVGRAEEALEESKAAVRSAPESGYAHFFAGLAFCNLGRFDEAMPELRKACDLEQRNASYLSGVGVCLAGKEQSAEAIDVQRKAIALDANCWEAQRLRSVLLKLREPEKAHAAWREGWQSTPGSWSPGTGTQSSACSCGTKPSTAAPQGVAQTLRQKR